MLTGVLLGAAWFCLFLLAHVLLFHFRRMVDRFQVIIRLFLAGVGAQFFSTWIGGASVAGALIGVVVMGSLFVLYMPLYYTIAASLSVRTLLVVRRAPDRRMPLDRLMDMFASVEVVRERLETMAANGYVTRDGDFYRPTLKGRCAARTFRAIKEIWRLGAGG